MSSSTNVNYSIASTSSCASSSQSQQTHGTERLNAEKIIKDLGCTLEDSVEKQIQFAVTSEKSSENLKVVLAYCKAKGRDYLKALSEVTWFADPLLVSIVKGKNPNLLLELLPYLEELSLGERKNLIAETFEEANQLRRLYSPCQDAPPPLLSYVLNFCSSECIQELIKLLTEDVFKSVAFNHCHWAAANKDPAVLKLLFQLMDESEQKSNLSGSCPEVVPDKLSYYPTTSLIDIAVSHKNVEVVRFLLSLYQRYNLNPLDINYGSKFEIFPAALSEMPLDIIESLEPFVDEMHLKWALWKGLYPTERSSASEKASNEVLQYWERLINLADRKNHDIGDATPLLFAIKSGSTAHIRDFINYYNKVGTKVDKSELLSLVAEEGSPENLKLVLDFIGDDFKSAVQFVDENGYTPIQIAAREGNTKVLLAIAAQLDNKELNRVMGPGKMGTPWYIMLNSEQPEKVLPVYTKLLPRLSKELQIATLSGAPSDVGKAHELLKKENLFAPMVQLYREFHPEALVTALKQGELTVVEVLTKGTSDQIRLIVALFKSLSPKTRLSLLSLCPGEHLLPSRYKRNLLHLAAVNKLASDFLSIMTPKEILMCMTPDENGMTPLHLVSTESDAKALSAWARKNQPKTLVSKNKLGESPLQTASKSPKAFAQLMASLNDKELLQSLEPTRKISPLVLLALRNNPLGTWKTLHKRLGREVFSRLMKADALGYNPFHIAFLNSSLDCVNFLIGTLSPRGLSEFFRPDIHGGTILSESANFPIDRFEFGIDLALKLDPKVAQQLTEVDEGGATLFHHVTAKQDNTSCSAHAAWTPGRYQLCYQLYKKAGKDPEKALLTANCRGELPLVQLAVCGVEEGYKELLDLFGPKVLAQSLLVPNTRAYFLTAIAAHLRSAIPLLDELKSDREVAKALKGQYLSKAIVAYLKKRYPRTDDCARVIMLSRLNNDKLLALPPYLGIDNQLQGSMRAAWEAQRWGKRELLKSAYPKLLDALAEKKKSIQEAISKTEVQNRKEALQGLLEKLENWQTQLCISLAIGGCPDSELPVFHPLLKRLQNLANVETRLALTQLLALYPITSEKTIELVKSWLKTCSSKNRPALHIIVLSALLQRDVEPTIIHELQERIMSNGKGRGLREGCTAGKALLSNLASLAKATELTSQDLNHTLMLALSGDLCRQLAAIGQIIQLGGARELKLERLTERIIRGETPKFQDMSFKIFQELIPVKDIKDFQKAYEEKISKQRAPNSLVTYASRLSGRRDTQQDLGRLLTWVLRGEFHQQRYAKDNSPHMKSLYAEMPNLADELPKLAKGMGTELLSELGAEETGITFPLDRKAIREKLLDDAHLKEANYPHIFAFLKAKNQQEAQKVIKAIENAKAKLKQSVSKDLAKLQLQDCLIALCSYSDDLTKETKGRELNKIHALMAKQLQELVRLSKTLEGELGQFSADIAGAQSTYINSQNKAPIDFAISVSDDYWDLLRIGTDVNGSCQSLHANGKMNKCLLDYVMHGKNFAIVARRPGTKNIAARRMLRIEIDSKTKKPALFLERFYGNYQYQALDDGLTMMAMKVAQRLKLPLYSNDRGDQVMEDNIQLESQKSAAEWSYSDAAKGAYSCGYKFEPQRCLFKVRNAQASSSSSSACTSSSSQ